MGDGTSPVQERTDVPERLLSQIAFYEGRANKYWHRHATLRTIQIFLSFAIPVVSLFIKDEESLRASAIILGSALSALESYRQFHKSDQHWQRWRLAAEKLKRELALYVQIAGDYKESDARSRLSERVEVLIEEERNDWIRLERAANGPESHSIKGNQPTGSS